MNNRRIPSMRSRLTIESAEAMSGVWKKRETDYVRPPDCGSLAFQLRDDLIVFRKNSGLVLRVNLLAIGDDIEDASAAFDQLALDTSRCSQRIRQTDGFGRVVSLDAVRDGNVHDASFAGMN